MKGQRKQGSEITQKYNKISLDLEMMSKSPLRIKHKQWGGEEDPTKVCCHGLLEHQE